MADEIDSQDTDTESGKTAEVPAVIADKFAEVFDNASEADLADAGESSQPAEPGRRRQAAAEAQDELEADGLISPENPDGSLPPSEQPADSVSGTAASEAVTEQQNPTDAPQIDPALRMAANGMGWSDAKIDRLYKADPELATETLTDLASAYTDLSRQMLVGVGSQPKAGTQQTQQAAQNVVTPKLDDFYGKIEAFAETNGQELADFAKALKTELIDPVKEIFAANQAKQSELLATEARQTITDLGKQFSQFYGTDGKALSAIEQNNRAYLARVADQLRAGAERQGWEMSVSDALKRAHLVVTSQYRDQIVRNEIKQQVQSRSKARTALPTQRNDPRSMGRSKEKATEAVARKMAEIGLDELS